MVLRIVCVFFAYLALFQPYLSAQTFSYQNEPLLSIISDIEEQTAYRFLYREALISDVRVTIQSSESSILDELSSYLRSQNIGLKVDKERYQALIYKSTDSQKSKIIHVSGYVLDAGTGERLPYSTISWRDNGKLQGVSSTPSGSFNLITDSEALELSFVVTFVGYKPKIFELNFEEQQTWQDISIRLEPEPYSGKEIIVRGLNFYTSSDTVLEGLIKVGAFSPLGETNAVRSLQMLPSVSMSAAINDGINIRGSSSDGFQVLLDGQTIYHQSHLFGLLDAMNPDVLKTSGFYYDVTPAQYEAPLGGTLSLITRTGSLNEVRGSAGVSNTAIKSSIELPVAEGRSSLLLSGRLSYLDELNWMNNQDLIEYGLDVNRPAELKFQNQDPREREIVEDVSLSEINVQNTDARFYDIHSKFYLETKSGNQFSVSGYFGYDNSFQNYLRDEPGPGTLPRPTTLYETSNLWSTNTLSANYNSRISDFTYSSSTIGFSSYNSEYLKEDFEYQRRNNNNDSQRDTSIIAPLGLENNLFEFSINQTFISSFDGINMEYGFDYSDYEVEYVEESIQRNAFISNRTSQLIDFFHQLDITSLESINLNLGNRIHYFSNGEYLRWSPRIKAQFFSKAPVSFGLGFSRNYQFMHRLQFYNINSTDFWTLGNEDQPPSSVNYYSAGIQFNSFDHLYFQVEGYYKDFENLRFHELSTGSISATFKSDDVPWFHDNTGLGKGVEFLMKNTLPGFNLTTAYTLSSSEIKNERINNGEFYYADWDRRHQLSIASEIDIKPGLDLFLSWTYGSGTPNRVDPQRFQNTSRLSDYSRVDLTLSYAIPTRSGSLKTSFSVYNVLNRENPWYSEVKQGVARLRNRDVSFSARADVFDLGIQPSFNVGFYF